MSKRFKLMVLCGVGLFVSIYVADWVDGHGGPKWLSYPIGGVGAVCALALVALKLSPYVRRS